MRNCIFGEKWKTLFREASSSLQVFAFQTLDVTPSSEGLTMFASLTVFNFTYIACFVTPMPRSCFVQLKKKKPHSDSIFTVCLLNVSIYRSLVTMQYSQKSTSWGVLGVHRSISTCSCSLISVIATQTSFSGCENKQRKEETIFTILKNKMFLEFG